MGEATLADTSGLLALINSSDRDHERCSSAFADLTLPLVTSLSVLTELFHLAGQRNRPAAWRILRAGSVRIAEIGNSELPRVEALMGQYADRPMDFADATLVHLAERERLDGIFTLDNNDFETYRIGGRKRFRIVPGR